MIGVRGGDDAGAQGDLVAAQPVRVARPVVMLLVMEHQRHDVHQFGRLFDDPFSQDRVLADAVPLLRREAARLCQDGVRDPDLAHVVQIAPVADAGHLRGGESDAPCDGRRELRHQARVGVGVAVAQVHRGGQATHDRAPSGVRQRDHVAGGFLAGQITRELHLVAAHRLGEIESSLGGLHQLGGGGPVLWVGAETEADGETELHAAGAQEHPAGDVLAKPLRHLQAALLVGMGQDHGELVASKTSHQIDFAQVGPQSAREFEQDPVSRAVTVAVVDGLEVVQVEHEQHERVAETVGPVALMGQAILKDPVAGDAGERVDRSGIEEMGGFRGPLPAEGQGREQHGRGGGEQDHRAEGEGARHLDRAEGQERGEAGQEGHEHDGRGQGGSPGCACQAQLSAADTMDATTRNPAVHTASPTRSRSERSMFVLLSPRAQPFDET